MWKIREIGETLTNVFLNLTPIECMVREATNDEKCAPNSQILNELANATYHVEDFPQLMSMLWYRIVREENWRHVYKGLLTMDYLLKNGSENVYHNVKDRLYRLERIISKTFVDDEKKDQTINITHRAKEICEMINNKDKYDQERNVAKLVRERMQDSHAVSNKDFRSQYESKKNAYTSKNTLRMLGDKIEGYTNKIEEKFDVDFDRFKNVNSLKKQDGSRFYDENDGYGDFVGATEAKTSYEGSKKKENTLEKSTNFQINNASSTKLPASSVNNPPKQENKSSVDDLLGLSVSSSSNVQTSNFNDYNFIRNDQLNQSLFTGPNDHSIYNVNQMHNNSNTMLNNSPSIMSGFNQQTYYNQGQMSTNQMFNSNQINNTPIFNPNQNNQFNSVQNNQSIASSGNNVSLFNNSQNTNQQHVTQNFNVAKTVESSNLIYSNLENFMKNSQPITKPSNSNNVPQNIHNMMPNMGYQQQQPMNYQMPPHQNPQMMGNFMNQQNMYGQYQQVSNPNQFYQQTNQFGSNLNQSNYR